MTVAAIAQDESPYRRLVSVGSPSNRLLRAALAAVAGLVVVRVAAELVGAIPLGVDLDIPLRAAARWVDGSQPYLASSFDVLPGASGRDLPFLYPPFLLPVLAVLLRVPHDLLLWSWAAFCLATALIAIRRLAIPAIWWPLVLCWPPFSAGLLSTNVQVPLFAAFVLAFWRSGAAEPWHPLVRPVQAVATRHGALALLVGAVKVSQIHGWLYLVPRRPRAALVPAVVLGSFILATVAITGIALWGDWLTQSERASDPSWPVIGGPLSVYVGLPLARLVAIASLVAAVLLRSERPGSWLGILMILASPTIQPFGWLFLLPAMLEVRREIGLVAAILIAVHSSATAWVAVAVVSGVLLASRRLPELLEPVGGRGDAPQTVAEPATA